MAAMRQAHDHGRAGLKPVTAATLLMPPLKSVRLLALLRKRIRLRHDSMRTEAALCTGLYWARACIQLDGLRMSKPAVPVWASGRRWLRNKAPAAGLRGLQFLA